MVEATTISFDTTVPANSTIRLRHDCTQDGVITRLYGRAYNGEERAVKRRVRKRIGGEDGYSVNLITNADDADESAHNYLSGNEQTWNFPMNIDYKESDILEAEITNTDPNNSYPVSLYLIVQDESLASSLRNALGGVL